LAATNSTYRHDQPDADEHTAPAADRLFKHPRHRRLAQLGELAARQDAIGHDRDAGEDGQHAEEAEDGGPADVLAALGEAGVHARSLHAEEHEHGGEHGPPHLVEQASHVVAAAHVVDEDVDVESEDRQHHEDQDRDDLGDRHHPVDRRRLLHAAHDEEREGPDPGRR
jgi:hypothetical protein